MGDGMYDASPRGGFVSWRSIYVLSRGREMPGPPFTEREPPVVSDYAVANQV